MQTFMEQNIHIMLFFVFLEDLFSKGFCEEGSAFEITAHRWENSHHG